MSIEQPEVDRTTNPSASIKDSLRILSPICFYFAVVTPTTSANFYFSSRPIYIFSKRNTTVRFVTTVFAFNHLTSPTNVRTIGLPSMLGIFSKREPLDQQTSYLVEILCLKGLFPFSKCQRSSPLHRSNFLELRKDDRE